MQICWTIIVKLKDRRKGRRGKVFRTASIYLVVFNSNVRSIMQAWRLLTLETRVDTRRSRLSGQRSAGGRVTVASTDTKRPVSSWRQTRFALDICAPTCLQHATVSESADRTNSKSVLRVPLNKNLYVALCGLGNLRTDPYNKQRSANIHIQDPLKSAQRSQV